MSTLSSGPWSPRYGSTTPGISTPSDINPPLSPSRYSYSSGTGSQRHSSDSDIDDSMRRIMVSPTPPSADSREEDYIDDNSIDEIQETLSTFEDTFDDTENGRTEWSDSRSGSYTSYTGSPSFVNLPHYSTSPGYSALTSPPGGYAAPARLSRITERTEEASRPNSGAYSAANRLSAHTPDHLRRSALLGLGGAMVGLGSSNPARHSRGATDPSGDRTLPPQGRANELISIFESRTQTTSSPSGHNRSSSTPGYRPESPRYGPRSASPTKSATSTTTSSYGSYIGSRSETRQTMSTVFSPPSRPYTATGTRTYTDSEVDDATTEFSQSTPYTQSQTPYSTLGSQTLTDTRTYDTRTTGTPLYSEDTGATITTMTPTYSSWTPMRATESNTTAGPVTPINTTLRRPQQASPRSPLTSVRNIVAAWKERSPGAAAKTGTRQDSPEKSPTKTTPADSRGHSDDIDYDDKGLVGIRRRMQRAGQLLRERESLGGEGSYTSPSTGFGNSMGSSGSGSGTQRDSRASIRSGKSGILPPGFDLSQFSSYTQSDEAPLHIGLLWYLNVHAAPPYRWQRCQALLYPHMLLLSWLSTGGGRGIVALDLANCTSVVSVPSPNHPSARDDVGTVAARLQMDDSRRDGRDEAPLMDVLVPFQMVYADGVERLAAESLGERSKWVNRIWEAVSRPETTPSITRSPTSSIRTITSISSSVSRSSTASSGTGSRSTRFVPPLSTIPDMDSYGSSSPTGSFARSDLSRRSSLISSHFTRTVDDTVIRSDGDEGYSYSGDDSRVITPGRVRRSRRSGSVGDLDLDDAWKRESKVSQRSDEDVFYSGSETRSTGSDISGTHSNVSSTYFSPDEGDTRSWLETPSNTYTGTFTPAGGSTSTSTYTYTPDSQSSSIRDTDDTYLSGNQDASPTFTGLSPSSLSRTREVRRRPGRAHSGSQSGIGSTISDASSDKENSEVGSGSYLSASNLSNSRSGGSSRVASELSGSGSYTPSGSYLSRDASSFSDSIPSLDGRDGSGTRTSGSYSGSGTEGVYSGSYSGSGTASYTRSYSGSETPSYSETYTGGDSSSDTLTRRDVRRDSRRDVVRGIERTAISSSETGYDICMSSDFTARQFTPDTTATEATVTPLLSVPLPTKTIQPMTDYEKFKLQAQSEDGLTISGRTSEVASIRSFASLSSIPSFKTASAVSSYKTASEIKVEPPSTFGTAQLWPSEIDDIPSEASTPTLSSLSLPLDFQPQTSAIPTPVLEMSTASPAKSPSVMRSPSLVMAKSSTKSSSISSPSLVSDLPPEEIPLPPSVRTWSEPALSERSVSEPPSPLPITVESASVRTPSSLAITPEPEELATEPSVTPDVSVAELRPHISTPSIASTPRSLSDIVLPEPEPEELPEEETEEHISLVSTLPPSITSSSSMSTSVLTPTSLSIAPSVASARPAPAAATPQPSITSRSLSVVTPVSVSSASHSTMSSTVSPSVMTDSSSSLPPLSPQNWSGTTNRSYDSSILQPSPSLLSLALHEGIDQSFETSFLRPSGSPSSVGRMSTIPPSPSALSSVQALRSLPPLTPVPALPESIDSATDARTPSTLSWFSSVTPSTLSSSPQSSISSFISEPSLPELPQENEGTEIDRHIAEDDISTIPSLLPSPETQAQSLTPTPSRSQLLATPTASAILSITTPHGGGETDKSSLRTIQSESTSVSEQDISEDINRLMDEVRRYDGQRGLENRDIVDNIRALQDELQGLSEFLHRPSSPAARPAMQVIPPFRVPTLTQPVRSVQLVDAGVGGSSIISSLRPLGPRDMGSVSLSRATSSASSIESYLSSHHSDDESLEDAERESMGSFLSPQMWQQSSTITTSSTELSDDYTPSSSPSSSPTRMTLSPSEQSTVTERAEPDLRVPLDDILKKLDTLGDGQHTINDLINDLRSRQPQPDRAPELMDRMGRIEDLIRGVIELQGHPRAAPIQPPEIIIEQRSEPSEGSLSDSSTSQDRLRDIDRLRQLLRGMTPADSLVTPIPVYAATGRSISAQLDEILNLGTGLPHVPQVQGPPQLIPFYPPVDRRRRSESPLSIDSLPARPYSEPPAQPEYEHVRQPSQREKDRIRRQPSLAESIQASQPLPTHDPTVARDPEEILRDQRRKRDRFGVPVPPAPVPPPAPAVPPSSQAPIAQFPQPDRFHYGPGPPPVHPFYTQSRPPTAPGDLGGDTGRIPQTWYVSRPSFQPRRQKPLPSPIATEPPVTRLADAPPAAAPAPPTQVAPKAPTYLPMPPGPTTVHIPLFDSLMEILRENRLAQLATVDQQRELMRYMRGLNEWLERDVFDRQNELRGVVARVDQLRDELRNMPSSTSSSYSETPSVTVVPMGQQMPQPTMPGPMPMPGGMQMPIPQHMPPMGPPMGFQPLGGPVIPHGGPVIPGHAPSHAHTPMPPGGPVIPQQPQPPTFLFTGGGPGVVPTMGGYGAQPHPTIPSHVPSRVQSEGGFVPDLSPQSTGDPRPVRPPTAGFDPGIPHIIDRPSSSSASSGTGTPRTSRRDDYPSASRRDDYPSRTGSRVSRRDSRRRRRRSSRSSSFDRSEPTNVRYSSPDGAQFVQPVPSAPSVHFEHIPVEPQPQMQPVTLVTPGGPQGLAPPQQPINITVHSPSRRSSRSSSRSSDRSRSRSRRRRRRSRSRSRSRSRTPPTQFQQPQQPTIILQQPPAPMQLQPQQGMMGPQTPMFPPQTPMLQPQTPMVEMQPTYAPSMPPPTIYGVPPTMQQPTVVGVPQTMMGVPQTMMGVPPTGYMPTMPPVIMQAPSRSSSRRSRSRDRDRRRSRSRSRDRRRSRSRSRERYQPTAAPAPAAPTAPVIITQESRRRSRSRSRSRSPRPQMMYPPTMMAPTAQQPQVVIQPQPTMGAPTMMPPMMQPTMMQPTMAGMPMMGQPPIIMQQRPPSLRRRSRSRSRSPRRDQQPIVVTAPTAPPAPSAPTMYPMAPTMMQPMMGQPMMGQPPVIVPAQSGRRSRSRSRSRERIIQVPAAPQAQPQLQAAPPVAVLPTMGGFPPGMAGYPPTVLQPIRGQSPRRRSRSRSPRSPRITQLPTMMPTAPTQQPTIVMAPPQPQPVLQHPVTLPRSPRRRSRSRSPRGGYYPRDRSPPRAGYHPRDRSPPRGGYYSRDRSPPRGGYYPRDRSPRGGQYRDRSRDYYPSRRGDSPRGYRSPPRVFSPSGRPMTGTAVTRPVTVTHMPRSSSLDSSRRTHRPRRPRTSRSYDSSAYSSTPSRERSHYRRRRRSRSASGSPRPIGRRPRSPRQRSRSPRQRSRSPRSRSMSPRLRSRSRSPRIRSPASGRHTPRPLAPSAPQTIRVERSPDRRPLEVHVTVPRPRSRSRQRPRSPSRPRSPRPTIVSIESDRRSPLYDRRTPSGDYDPRTSRYEDDRRRSPSPIIQVPTSPPIRVPTHELRETHVQRPLTTASSEAPLPIPAPTSTRPVTPAPGTPLTTVRPTPIPIPVPVSDRGTSPFPRVSPPVDRLATVTPFPFGPAGDDHERLEQLHQVAERLHDAAVAAQEAEDLRELEFRQHEEDRDRLFLEQETRRNEEARARHEAILREIDTRLTAIMPTAPAAPQPTAAPHTPAAPPVAPPSESSRTPSPTRPVHAVGGSPSPPSSPSLSSSSTPTPSSPSTRTAPSLHPDSAPSMRPDSIRPDSIRPGSVPPIRPDSPRRPAEPAQPRPTSALFLPDAGASQQFGEILETLRLEREEFALERAEAAAEREKLLADASVERERLLEDRDMRIKYLEDELVKVKDELAHEREFRATEEAANRERDREERAERDEALQQQLSDIAQLVQDQHSELENKRELMENRWVEKLGRRQTKDIEREELRDMVNKLQEEFIAEKGVCATKRDLEDVIDELRQQSAKQQDLLAMFSESWRADCARHQEETINAVKSTAREQVPFNVEGYLNEFSKALATEVRMLLGEVGKLRENRRALQHEIGFLLTMQSKYGPGGEFDPEWRPAPGGPGGPGGPPGDQPPPPPDVPEGPPEVPIARPGWRPVNPVKKKKKRQQQQQQQQQQQAPPPAAASIHEHLTGRTALPQRPVALSPRSQVRSWQAWLPDPSMQPSPGSVEPTLQVPRRDEAGLFGPPSSDGGSFR